MAAELPQGETFSGEITVASRIVDYLSSGLYRTPAACLKELINNSYDADADTVNVFIKPDADRIVIEDNGTGMSREEFQRHFSRVSESHKRDDRDVTDRGRPKIGKIGIGFIAANEICDTMELISTKAGSTERLWVTINFAEMRKDISERRRPAEGNGAIAKGDYEGRIDTADSSEHYTWLFLSGIRGHAQKVLASAYRQHGDARAWSLYGKSPESVEAILKNASIESWRQLDAYSETLVNVGLNVPVEYLPGWMPPPSKAVVEPFELAVKGLGFTVFVDGAPLHKPIVFREPERSVCEVFTFKGESVSAEGYFYAQRYALKPHDLAGLLLRVRNSAVGEYDPTFWEFPPDEAPLFQAWTSGEVWCDALEDAVNIDRRTLRVTHPTYVELQNAIHDFLRGFFSRARRELYSEPAAERRQDRAQTEVRRIAEIVTSPQSPLTPARGRELASRWQTSQPTESGKRRSPEKDLLQKFTVSQLYGVVIEVANEVLDRESAAKFVEALTRRLRR